MTKSEDARNRLAFWDFVAKLPCVVCYDAFYAWMLAQDDETYSHMLMMVQGLTETTSIQQSRTEIAHMGRSDSRRGVSQRYHWTEVWPLCGGHHREFDDAHHAGTAVFWTTHPKLDRDAIIDMLMLAFKANPIEATT